MSDKSEMMQKVSDIQARYVEALMKKRHVVGVGIGLKKRDGVITDQPSLVVMVDKKIPKAQLPPEDCIPDEIEGVPVDVQEVGTFHAQ